jgi:hypothetical protein|tara:strand:- start:371 stop:826 length:456 start_codon:yes stop_codon:yes gene_type:complete
MVAEQSPELRRVLTWDDYNELVSSIASQMGDWEPQAIVGLTRGGLIPAVQFSHMFNVKLYTLNISLRDGKAPSTKFNWKQLEKYERILIVDDINDSGATLHEVHNQFYGNALHNPRFATLLSKRSSKMSVDYVGEHINTSKEDDWIIFPWE